MMPAPAEHAEVRLDKLDWQPWPDCARLAQGEEPSWDQAIVGEVIIMRPTNPPKDREAARMGHYLIRVGNNVFYDVDPLMAQCLLNEYGGKK